MAFPHADAHVEGQHDVRAVGAEGIGKGAGEVVAGEADGAAGDAQIERGAHAEPAHHPRRHLEERHLDDRLRRQRQPEHHARGVEHLLEW